MENMHCFIIIILYPTIGLIRYDNLSAPLGGEYALFY